MLLAVLFLSTSLACKMLIPGSKNGVETGTIPSENNPQPKKTPQASSNQQYPGELRGPGDFDLPEPAIGLDKLDSYTQRLVYQVETALHNQPYLSTTSTERTMAGGQTLGILEAETSGSQPIYRAALRTADALYVQQERLQACRASQDTQRADPVTNPALRLPPVFGAEEAGRENIDGMAAIHYRFDQRAVRYAAGQNGTASGELWVTADSGLLLKYSLTVETSGGDSPGVQTWEYSLSQINSASAVRLPDGCLTLPLDLPILPGAQDVTLRPGVARYNSVETQETAARFYRDEMSAAGWQAVPSDEMSEGALALTFIQPQEKGSRLAVVRLEATGGKLQVIIQTIQMKYPVQVDAQNATASELEQPEVPQPPGLDQPPSMPVGLPIYPGASDVTNNEYILMFSTRDRSEKVAAYYQSELNALGWSLDEDSAIAGIITQTWVKDDLQLFMMIMQQDNATQVMITSGG
jgi:hypothetical protein